MDHHAHRRANGQSHPVYDAVVDPDELHLERADLQPLPRQHLVQRSRGEQLVLFQLVADDTQGKGGSENRYVDLSEQIRQRPDMILVGMGEHDPRYASPVLAQIVHIRDDVIHPQHVSFGEHQAGIDDENRIAVFHRHHVQADFAQAAQGDQFQHNPYDSRLSVSKLSIRIDRMCSSSASLVLRV